MAKSKVKVKLDKRALRKVAEQAVRESVSNGMDGTCPFCGGDIVFMSPVTTCPHCGETFRLTTAGR